MYLLLLLCSFPHQVDGRAPAFTYHMVAVHLTRALPASIRIRSVSQIPRAHGLLHARMRQSCRHRDRHSDQPTDPSSDPEFHSEFSARLETHEPRSFLQDRVHL